MKAPAETTTTSTKVLLTKTVIDRATPVLIDGVFKRQRLYFDTKEPNFGLSVGKRSKSFFVYKTHKGRTTYHTIGKYGDDWPLEKARARAAEVRAEITKGRHPGSRPVDKVTLADALETYERDDGHNERTARDHRYAFNKYLADWLPRRLVSIERPEVLERYRELREAIARGKYALRDDEGKPRAHKLRTGATTAHHVMHALRTVWNRMRDVYPELPESPTRAIRAARRGKGNSLAPPTSKRPLTEQQLPFWLSAISARANEVQRDANLLALFTGLRSRDVVTMTWSNVHFGENRIHIPEPKGGKDRAFDVPMTTYIAAILRGRQAGNAELLRKRFLPEATDLVFPTRSRDWKHTVPLNSWGPRIFENVDTHSLRRTFMTCAESLELSPYVIKRLVNHTSRDDVTATYLKISPERLLHASQQITDKLLMSGEKAKLPYVPKPRAAKKKS